MGARGPPRPGLGKAAEKGESVPAHPDLTSERPTVTLSLPIFGRSPSHDVRPYEKYYGQLRN